MIHAEHAGTRRAKKAGGARPSEATGVPIGRSHGVSFPHPWRPTACSRPPASRSASDARCSSGGSPRCASSNRAYTAARDKKQTRTLTVLGASGVGKTRLVRDFLVKAREAGLAPARLPRRPPATTARRTSVFARVLRARFGIVEGMDAEAAKAQVRAQVATVLEDRKVGDVVYFLGPAPRPRSSWTRRSSGRARATPQQLRSLRRAVIKSFLEADAAKGGEPLVLVFDDLHCAHDESLELLAYLVESLAAPILVLCLARPEMIARRDGWKQPRRRPAHARRALAALARPTPRPSCTISSRPCGDAEGDRRSRRRRVHARGRKPRAPRADGPHLPRHGRARGHRRLRRGRALERSTSDKLASVKLPLTRARTPCRRASRRSRRRSASCSSARRRWAASSGSAASSRSTRLDESPPDVWYGGDARRRRGDPASCSRSSSSATTSCACPTARSRATRSTSSSTTSSARRWCKLTPAGRRAPLPPGDRRLARVQGARATTHEEYLGMLARHREKAGAIAQAAGAYLAGRPTSRARATRTPRPRSYYAKGLALLEQGAEADEDQRLARAPPLRRRPPGARAATTRRSRAFREMLARAYRLDLRTQGRRRALAHRAPLPRDGAPRRGVAAPRTRRSRSSSRPATSAASPAPSTTSASSTGCGRLPAGARVHAARARDAPQDRRSALASRSRSTTWASCYQDSGQFKRRARRLRAGAPHPARHRRPRRRVASR